jgi:hypothetical protein
MKALLLIGGILGFGIGLSFSWIQENAWPSTLWHACLGAYLASQLLRWWGSAWRRNLEMALADNQSQSSSIDAPSFSKATK